MGALNSCIVLLTWREAPPPPSILELLLFYLESLGKSDLGISLPKIRRLKLENAMITTVTLSSVLLTRAFLMIY